MNITAGNRPEEHIEQKHESAMEEEFIDRIMKLTNDQRVRLLEYAIHMLEEAEP